MNFKSENTWRVGTTTFNRSDLISELQSLLELMNEFNKNNRISWENKQDLFVKYVSENNPDLFTSNKEDKKEIARQLTSALVNFNLADKKREINENGLLLVEHNEWVQKIASHFNISYKNVVYIIALSSKTSDNGAFNPIKVILENANSEFLLSDLLKTHKAETRDEFVRLMKGAEFSDCLDFENLKTDMTEKIITSNYFHNNNGIAKNNYIKEIYKCALNVMLKNLDIQNYLDISSMVAGNNSKQKDIFTNVLDYVKNGSAANIEDFNKNIFKIISEIYMSETVAGQKSQTLNALVMMGVFEFTKIKSDYKIKLNNSLPNISQIWELTEGIENAKEFAKKCTETFSAKAEQFDILKIVEKIVGERDDVFSHMSKGTLFTIKEFPQELLIDIKSYVLLEYLVVIKLAMIFKKNIFDIIPRDRFDKRGVLSNHAPGGGADFVVDNFVFEVTNSTSENTEKLEIEPVTRHLAKYKAIQNDAICFFFGNDPLSHNFSYDALMKKNYQYLVKIQKPTRMNKVVNDLNIVSTKYKDLDKINSISQLMKLVEIHKSFFLDQSKDMVSEIERYWKEIQDAL